MMNKETLEARLISVEHQIRDLQKTIEIQSNKLQELNDIESIK